MENRKGNTKPPPSLRSVPGDQVQEEAIELEESSELLVKKDESAQSLTSVSAPWSNLLLENRIKTNFKGMDKMLPWSIFNEIADESELKSVPRELRKIIYEYNYHDLEAIVANYLQSTSKSTIVIIEIKKLKPVQDARGAETLGEAKETKKTKELRESIKPRESKDPIEAKESKDPIDPKESKDPISSVELIEPKETALSSPEKILSKKIMTAFYFENTRVATALNEFTVEQRKQLLSSPCFDPMLKLYFMTQVEFASVITAETLYYLREILSSLMSGLCYHIEVNSIATHDQVALIRQAKSHQIYIYSKEAYTKFLEYCSLYPPNLIHALLIKIAAFFDLSSSFRNLVEKSGLHICLPGFDLSDIELSDLQMYAPNLIRFTTTKNIYELNIPGADMRGAMITCSRICGLNVEGGNVTKVTWPDPFNFVMQRNNFINVKIDEAGKSQVLKILQDSFNSLNFSSRHPFNKIHPVSWEIFEPIKLYVNYLSVKKRLANYGVSKGGNGNFFSRCIQRVNHLFSSQQLSWEEAVPLHYALAAETVAQFKEITAQIPEELLKKPRFQSALQQTIRNLAKHEIEIRKQQEEEEKEVTGLSLRKV